MATGISWTDETWNPVKGCSRVSAGCQHCYAEAQAARIVRMGKGMPTAYDGLVKVTAGGEPRWTGRLGFDFEHLGNPLRWQRPRRIFVNSMSDLFHEDVPDEWIVDIFAVMALAPRHTFQILTKRPKRMREFLTASSREFSVAGRVIGRAWEMLGRVGAGRVIARPDRYRHEGIAARPWPLPNVWLGVSVENQEAADERIPELLRTPAAVRFLSCEPLLGPVDLRGVPVPPSIGDVEASRRLHWIIAGCESGPGARPCSVEWLRSLRDQCAAAGVPFFLKQAVCEMRFAPGRGAVSTGIDFGPGSKATRSLIELPYLDGVQHAAFPEVAL